MYLIIDFLLLHFTRPAVMNVITGRLLEYAHQFLLPFMICGCSYTADLAITVNTEVTLKVWFMQYPST